MALESFRHWQSRSIDQKQAASSLMMGLSGGALAFSTSLLDDATIFMGCTQSTLFHLHGGAQLCSLALGVAFSINRVRDFDLTSQIARARERNPQSPSLQSMRATVRRWGRVSRRLYFWQGLTFVLGALAFVGFVLTRYAAVLYHA
jgi:hypothetical protein